MPSGTTSKRLGSWPKAWVCFSAALPLPIILTLRGAMLVVSTFFWKDPTRHNRGYTFSDNNVRILAAMVKRNLTIPHRFVCVTDHDIEGIETIPVDFSKHIPGTVFCRLAQHAPDYGDKIGADRILSLDLDMVVTGSLDKLVSRTEDFIIWKNPNFPAPKRAYFQSSVQLFTTGSKSELYTDFDPATTPTWVNWRFGGREQAWISERLSWKDTPVFTSEDGVYGLGRLRGAGIYETLPENCCLVSTPGARAPWQPEVQNDFPWIKDHYHV
jgi:hypothetical protein